MSPQLPLVPVPLLKDNNLRCARDTFKKMSGRPPLLVWPANVAELCRSITADVELLVDFHCMDYSFLVALVPEGAEQKAEFDDSEYKWCRVTFSGRPYRAYYGIIDILCRWDARKRAAQVAKMALGSSRRGLSTAPPERYGRRFLSFVSSVFDDDPAKDLRSG
eukprot:scaffold922_cov327-Pinguiococcus_pyrenoidosus.AAC.47